MFYLGIDPGLGGGIAIVDPNGVIIRAVRMPGTERDILEAIDPGVQNGICAFAVIERVGAFPRMGCVSAFTFGRGFGGLLMALTASRYPFELVQPAKWQGAMGCLTGGDKNVSKRRAQQLFPGVAVTHAVADAILLSEYARRLRLGLFVPPSSQKTKATHGQEVVPVKKEVSQAASQEGRQVQRRRRQA